MTDDEWWQAYCIESLELDPWHPGEKRYDGHGYLYVRPEKQRRRIEWEERNGKGNIVAATEGGREGYAGT